MFDTGFGTILYSLLVNILVPIVPGILFLWLFFGTKRKGMVLFILAWFVGVGVVAHWLFNLQFVRFGIGIEEYFVLVLILLLSLGGKIRIKKQSRSDYFPTLNINCDCNQGFKERKQFGRGMKLLTGGMLLSIIWFLINSFVFTTHFPTYADDSFWNRNKPILNILHDGGVKLFGERDEILARGRLGYPIHIPLYKALIAEMQGGYNDITTDMVNRLSMFFILSFLTIVTRQKTKNILYSLLSATLIISLPLIFIHTVESYHEVLSGIYVVLAILLLSSFFQEYDWKNITLSIVILGILAFIKNDGLVVYMPGILLSFFITAIVFSNRSERGKLFLGMKKNLMGLFTIFIFFILPFLFIKQYHGLGSNQAAGQESGIGLSNTIHWEIFDLFPQLFFGMDNFGVSLIVIGIMLIFSLFMRNNKRNKKNKKNPSLFFMNITPLLLFLLLILVFLLTENYKVVLDQTTVNRVFTVCLLIFFAFFPQILHEYEE